MECHYSLITVLDRIPRSSHPWYSYRMCLQHIFYSSSTSHTLCQQSDETLFGCFIIELNAAFNQQLSLADEGYENGSDTIDLPTPLRKTPCIYHISSREHASFNPVFTSPHSTPQTPPRPVHRHLSLSSADNCISDSTQACSDSSDEGEQDFQMVPLDDEHWRNAWKTFMYPWTWTTTWIMPVPMSLYKL